MAEIPAEAVQAAAEALSSHKWSERSWAAHRSHKFDSGCAVCQGDVSAIAGVVLAAIAEHPAQPSGTIQDCETSGPGITGPIGNEKPAASLSGAREEILRKHLDIVVRTRAASRDGSKLTAEALIDFVDQLVELMDMSEKGELV